MFAQVIDPVGAGFVESLARPGGNATGFTQYEYGLSAKWRAERPASHFPTLGLLTLLPSSARPQCLRDLRDGGLLGVSHRDAAEAEETAFGGCLRDLFGYML